MNEIITGQAILHGVKNNGTAISITGYATFLLDRVEGEHGFEGYKVKDNLGNTASVVAFDELEHLVIDFTPSGATRAAAALIPAYPIPLAAVTLANLLVATTFGTSSGQLFNGTFLYEGGARIMQQAGIACKLTGLKLTKWADATQNTSLTTTVVG